MRIIDAHVHVFPQSFKQEFPSLFQQTNLRIKHLLNVMDRNGIELSILQPLQIDEKFNVPNEFVMNVSNRFPDRFRWFASLDPRNHEDFPQLVEYKKSRCVGLKLYPAIGFYPNQTTFEYLYEIAIKNKMPVLFHTGIPFPYPTLNAEYGKPKYIGELAESFPELNIIAAHMANPWYHDMIKVLMKNNNVYADISSCYTIYPIKKALRAGESDKIIFSSDFSGEVSDLNVWRSIELVKQLSKENQVKIFHENIERLCEINQI